MNSIGFIGLGKLGLDCAEVFAEQYDVYGYDIYPRQSRGLNICKSIKEVVKNCDWIFIAVPTPHDEGYDGSVPSSHKEPKDFDHSTVTDVLVEINKCAKKSKNIVLISTVLPGTSRKHFVNLLDKKHQFFYNPYLIAMGSVKWDMVNPEMIMIGTEDGDETAAQQLVEIYRPIMQNDPRYVIGTWDECEAIKIFYNTFISTKIGLVNMIQDCAMRVGNINVDVVTDALAASTMRIMGSKYMTAGLGDSGACVLPNFLVKVDRKVITIEELYNTFTDEETHLIESANWAITQKDEKKIDRVTSRDYVGEILKFTDGNTVLLECTPDHLVPVTRSGKRMVIRADQVAETDKLYRL